VAQWPADLEEELLLVFRDAGPDPGIHRAATAPHHGFQVPGQVRASRP
jgi:hypothetical protein